MLIVSEKSLMYNSRWQFCREKETIMRYTEICNDKWLFVWVGVLLLAVVGQCLIYMRRAWKHGEEIGLSAEQLKKGLTTGTTISIMPTLPVLLVLFSLTPLLGVPLPWLRLSVIGSAYYETYAASTALSCLGETFEVGAFSAEGWIACLWVMTVGGSACVLWSALAIKPISMIYEKAEKIDLKLVLAVGGGCLAGIMAYVSVSYGFSAMSTKGVVFCISFAVGALLTWLKNRNEKLRWLSDYIMTISMVAAMAAACIIF